jgi:transposase
LHQNIRKTKNKLLTDSNFIKVPLNLPELMVISQTVTKDSLRVKVQAVSSQARCPHCQTFSSQMLNDNRWRLVQDLPALQFKVWLHLCQRRFFCATCQKRFVERFSFVAEKARLTKRLQSHLLQQMRSRSMLQTALTNQVSYRQTAYLCFAKGSSLATLADSQTLPKRLGIDEFALRKGHRYATALTNLEKAEICGIGKERTTQTVKTLFGTNKNRLKRVREVAMDMWKPFHAAVKKCLPHAKRVIDRFHVERYFTKAVDKCRKRWQKSDKELGKKLKNQRKLFITKVENLTFEEKQLRDEILREIPELKRAVRLLEALQNWYQTPKEQENAEHKLRILIRILRLSNIEEMVELAKTLETWASEIANYFLSYASNGTSEGFNTKIKLIKRVGYGRLTFTHLQARIFLECFQPP